ASFPCLLLLTLRPPRPTLFPYTTLFRSLKEQQRVIGQLGDAINSTIGGTGAAAFDAYASSMDKTISLNNLFSDSTGRAFRNARPDRKSTRLNSSHLVISYAVFCLKKKNK